MVSSTSAASPTPTSTTGSGYTSSGASQINSLLNGTSSSGYSGSSSSTSSSSTSGTNALTPTDFINMMITQLKNQDPMQPTSDADLLAQMSQIGQLQASETLQTSLSGMVLQNQIGSAANFIGKNVTGMDVNNNTIGGSVTSVSVESSGVSLNLDSGVSLALNRVTQIDGADSSAATDAGATTTAGATPTPTPTPTSTGS